MNHEEIVEKKNETYLAVRNFNSLLGTFAIVIAIAILIFMYASVSSKLSEVNRRSIDLKIKIEQIQDKLEAYE